MNIKDFLLVLGVLGVALAAPQAPVKTTTSAATTSPTTTTSSTTRRADDDIVEKQERPLLYTQIASPFRQLFPGTTTYQQFIQPPQYNNQIGYTRVSPVQNGPSYQNVQPAYRDGSLVGVLYSAAPQVSHIVFDGFGIRYEY